VGTADQSQTIQTFISNLFYVEMNGRTIRKLFSSPAILKQPKCHNITIIEVNTIWPQGMDGLRNHGPLGLDVSRPPPPHPEKKNILFLKTSLTKQSVWNNDTGAEQTT